jgi:geranylgeranyl reductase family protein
MTKDQTLKNKYDVIVVGAGPGGCGAAFHCARKGMSVLLLDKASFPRDKICGDGLSHAAIECLETMGMVDILEQNNGAKIREIQVTAPDNTFVKGEPLKGPDMRKHAMVLPRNIFDNQLLEKTKQTHGVTVLENTRAIDLVNENTTMQIVAKNSQQKIIKISSSYVIGADGAVSVIARKIGINIRKFQQGNFAMRSYFHNVSGLSDCIELYCFKEHIPGYAWIFPAGSDLANVGIMIPQKRHSANKYLLKSLFQNIITKSALSEERFEKAVQVPGSFKGWPLPVFPYSIARCKGNTLLIGDAAGFTDPLTGEGTYYALKSGELAAEAISNAQNPLEHRDVSRLYEKKWRQSFLWKEFIPSLLLRFGFSFESLVNWKINSVSKSDKKAGIYLGAVGHTLPKSKLFIP